MWLSPWTYRHIGAVHQALSHWSREPLHRLGSLEKEFTDKLDCTPGLWICIHVRSRRTRHRGDHAEESWTIRVVAIRLPEIGMVKCIEGLHANLDITSFFRTQREILIETQVRVVKSRPMKEVALHVA